MMHTVEITISWCTQNPTISFPLGWRRIIVTLSIGLLLPVGVLLADSASVRSVVGLVLVSRDGVSVPSAVKSGAMLEDADELRGDAANSSIQIECPSGATQTLVGRFDAVLNPTNKQTDCAIDLKAGTAVATTTLSGEGDAHDDDASIRGGPIAMTSHHTQFGLTVTPSSSQSIPKAEGFVLDGDAICRELASGKEWMIGSGNQIKITATSKMTSPVEPAKYQQLALTFARLDVSQLNVVSRYAKEKQLQARWLQVMQQPENLNARVELAEAQSTLGATGSHVAVYQAKRANMLAAQTSDAVLQMMLTQQASIPEKETSTAPATSPGSESQLSPFRTGTGFALGAAFASRSKTFENPTQDGHRVDWCLHWTADCGQPAADAWCRQQGFSAASKFVIAENIGAESPTVVIGDGKLCSDSGCDGFSTVTCRR